MKTDKQLSFAQNFLLYFEKHYLLLTFILALGASLCGLGVFWYLTRDIFYIDTDGYTRALRIIDWLQNFQWSEKIFPYYNPPHGFVLHWTRICDVIWALLAAPFLFFFPIKEAIFYGGLLFSPLFMALSMMCIIWGIKPYLTDFKTKSTALLTVIAALLFYAIKLNDVFDAVRPDHHSLMCFVFCFNIAVILHSCRQQNLRLTLLAGLTSGCGMWASSAAEGLFTTMTMLFVLSVNWIFYGHTLKEQIYYTLGVFFGVTLAWLINPPFGGWLMIDTQRLSVLHVVLIGLMLLSFCSIIFFHIQTKIQKIITLTSVALLTILIMIGIFGLDLWLKPLFVNDTWEYCFKYTGELQHLPLLSYETPNIIITVMTLIGLFIVCGRSKHLINLGILTIFCMATTIYFWRFYTYLMMIFLFLCGLLLYELLYRAQDNIKFKWLAFAYLVAPMLFLIAFYLNPEQSKIPLMKNSALIDVIDVPELVFTQKVDAIGGPYHTNVEGIIDNHLMWFATDEDELKKLIKKHHIRSIYLEPYSRPDYYVEPEKNTDKFYGKIMTGKNIYNWLKKIDDGHYEISLNLL